VIRLTWLKKQLNNNRIKKGGFKASYVKIKEDYLPSAETDFPEGKRRPIRHLKWFWICIKLKKL
jgi:hypothetical protein